MNRDLNRRLAKVEGVHVLHEPARILADRPMTDEEAAEALAGWRELVAAGKASVMAGNAMNFSAVSGSRL